MAELPGYRGAALELLAKHGVSVGDTILVRTDVAAYEGVLMPRYELADDQHIVIKLASGYNVGVRVERVASVARRAPGLKPAFVSPPRPEVNPALPRVAIISTGGTIASRVDYRTGGVRPALTASELYSTVPELAEYAQIECEVLFSIYSENMTPAHWRALAERVAERVSEGVRGVVVTHGTDTMAYTSAALSFALQGCPVPVVLVGSQRSSDRPSSDAALNLIGAVLLAGTAPFAGVFVVMHASLGDDVLAVHLGTKVRKNHTSRRDAFESVSIPPVAYVTGEHIEQVAPYLPARRATDGFMAKPKFEPKVALVKFHPGMDHRVFDYYRERGYRGLVVEGSGLGHVSADCVRALSVAVAQGILVGMTSQCLWGRVRMTVYDTGRDLLSAGVVPLGDMLPETAFVKMMWVLQNARTPEEARMLLLQDLAGEYALRSPLDRRPRR